MDILRVQIPSEGASIVYNGRKHVGFQNRDDQYGAVVGIRIPQGDWTEV